MCLRCEMMEACYEKPNLNIVLLNMDLFKVNLNYKSIYMV